jgi:dihydroflavonol-4-reductase
MPTALVTGANGFIGAHLVRELIKRGYEVRCLVRHTSDLASIKDLDVPLYIGDLRDEESLVKPVKDVEYVFHLAAELMVTSKEEFEDANTQGTKNLLNTAEKYAGAKLKRFLFVSSQAGAGPGLDPTPIDETKLSNPISWYGTSKMKAEEATLEFGKRIPVTIVRPSAVYGEQEKDLSQTYAIVENRIQPKLGIKKKYLVMVYVADLVEGIIAAAESPNTLNQTYFLNHPEVLTAKTTIKTIARAMNKSFGISMPTPLFLIRLVAPFAELIYHFTRERPQMTRDKAREISQRFWVADPSNANKDFGWEAKHSLLEGMKKVVPVYRREQKELKEMPLETGLLMYIKYLLVAILIGSSLETFSYFAGFYRLDPPWGTVVIAVGIIGIGFGLLSVALKKMHWVLQFIIGYIIAGAVEALNYLNILPLIHWEFARGFPLGIVDPWIRTAVLATPGGLMIIVVNMIMRSMYKNRLSRG